MNKYIFWWDSPCKGMIGVLKYFCENLSIESIAITGDTGKFRRSMGWKDRGVYFKSHIIIPRDEYWIEKTTKIFNQYKVGYIHVFGGLTRNKTEHLVKMAIKSNIQFCVMTEAPLNNQFGIKRFLKKLYISFFLPILRYNIAKKSSLVFCLSCKKNSDLDKLKRLGFKENTIIQFGYWTNTEYEDLNIVELNEKVSLFCPGFLGRIKRVDLLVSAIHVLIKKGYTNFVCHIIGDGIEKEKLQREVKNKNIEKYIVFHGVLDESNPLITKSDILVAPGSFEPWGIRINEAIQRGQVVISSKGIGASYLIEESDGGKVFKNGSYKQLADAIQYYLDDYERINIAKKNNIKYRDKISCELKAKELYSYLEKL